LKDLEQRLKSKLTNIKADITKDQLMEYLEFSDDADFYEAFLLLEQEDGMQIVGKGGKRIHRHYLLDQWANGHGAGIFQFMVREEHAHVWAMSPGSRK
jgi:hypothetical protein